MKQAEISQELRRREIERKVQRGFAPAGREPGTWEVTAVDATAQTCTVQALYDASTKMTYVERTGVYYDTNNEPSAGDIGVLTRLGDGSLFFFKKGAGTAIHSAGSTDGRTVGGGVFNYIEKYNGNWSVATDLWVVWKFSKSISLPATQACVYYTGDADDMTTYFSNKGGGDASEIIAKVFAGPILEDFTLDTLDKATMLSLTKIVHPTFFRAKTTSTVDYLQGGFLRNQTYDSNWRFAGTLGGAANRVIYGGVVYTDSIVSFTGSPIAGDERGVNTAGYFSHSAGFNIVTYST